MSFLIIILATLISLLFGFLRYQYISWELRGVKQLKTHFLFGNFFFLRSVHLAELLHEVYQTYKGQVKVAGAYIFTKPIAVVLDLNIVKAILIKDFNKFTDRNEYNEEEREPLMTHLFQLPGEKWRNMRSKLTPTFTSGKMKFMFPTIVDVAKQFELAFEKLVENSNNGIVELHDIMGRFTTDVIGTCAFGLECNSLKDPDVEFRRMGLIIFDCDNFSVPWTLFKQTYRYIVKRLGVRHLPQDFTEFIMRVVSETVKTREEQKIQRNDFLNLLIELKNTKDPTSGLPVLTIKQIAAQVFVFFVAGFETSSSNMSYGLFELAKNPEVQERVRQEIIEVLERHDHVLTYEAMMEMTYLDQMITETLRKYPALTALTRIATQDYTVPGTNITLAKNTKVYIPITEIHYDPEIYVNPHEFNPDRFSPTAVQARHPQAFLGFGDGPRNCIGLRFGRMQVRVGLITLLKRFKFSLTDDLPNELKLSKYSFIMIPSESGVHVKAEKL